MRRLEPEIRKASVRSADRGCGAYAAEPVLAAVDFLLPWVRKLVSFPLARRETPIRASVGRARRRKIVGTIAGADHPVGFYRLCWQTKKAAAYFKSSRSKRNSAFSRRRRSNCACPSASSTAPVSSAEAARR